MYSGDMPHIKYQPICPINGSQRSTGLNKKYFEYRMAEIIFHNFYQLFISTHKRSYQALAGLSINYSYNENQVAILLIFFHFIIKKGENIGF